MHPCCRVQSEASKFPLSTEETKRGAIGSKRASVIPVQDVSTMLWSDSKWCRAKGLFGEFRHREISKFTSHLPRIEQKPDVRGRYAGATAAGCSCTLSGINQLCSAVLYSAKYRHVFRAVSRRKATFAGEVRFRVVAGGRLSQLETSFTAGPKRQDRQRGRERLRPHHAHTKSQYDRENGHPVEIHVHRAVRSGIQFRLRCGFPFQEPACVTKRRTSARTTASSASMV
jgi:hypothetical protein